MAYQESQAVFAQRVALTAMTVSKFERGETVPRDPSVLQSLLAAAEEVHLNTEAEQFATARKEALSIELVNRTYPGPREQAMTIRFETLREWKAMVIALFSERYKAEIGAVGAIVDHVVRDADMSRGIGPGWYHELEARVKTLMEEREQRISTANS
jgi:transcriptional regulator with XRE-family HTH domain